jgi:hypothetical protein
MTKQLRAADCLPGDIISLVVSALEENGDEDWEGGTVYFPSSRNPTSSLWTTEEKARKRALSVVAVIDGFSLAEAAAMTDVSERLVRSWVSRYREPVQSALDKVREDK